MAQGASLPRWWVVKQSLSFPLPSQERSTNELAQRVLFKSRLDAPAFDLLRPPMLLLSHRTAITNVPTSIPALEVVISGTAMVL